jgi:hypothetical protein
MSAAIDRNTWPWNAAPVDVDDYDAATWHAVRKTSAMMGGPILPVQDLEPWVCEQRASRHRDRLNPEPYTEQEHAQLRADLADAWRAVEGRSLPRRFAGRLPR